MTDDKFWSVRHARALAQAREARGLEPFKFATQHALSLKQLMELESAGCNAFYSERIKFDVGNRLLRKLGFTLEPLPETPPEPGFVPVPAPAASDAIALDPAPSSTAAPVQAAPARALLPASPPSGRARALWWAAGSLVLLAAGILAIHPWQSPSRGMPSTAALPAPATSARPSDASVDPSPGADTGFMTSAATTPEAAGSPPPPVAEASASPQPLRQDVSASLCQFSGPGAAFTPAQATKAGDYVYLLAQQDTRLCLIDATGHQTTLTLAAGQTANITGQPPFKLAAAPGAQVQVFYQGKRVAWPAEASHVVLNQAARASQP